MKRLMTLLLLCLLPGLASAQGYQLVEYQGVAYEYNPTITTILYAGVDSDGPMTTTDRYTIAPRADTINLIILDGYHQTMRILSISRDTMAAIDRYTMDGTWRDQYVSHLGYAYTYGDGGRVSCENLASAVSRLLGGVPIHEYVVTNKSGIVAGNALLGGVQVTVPNNDVAHLHPELTAGATVTLTDENVLDYTLYRDTSIPYSNNGRLARQETFIKSFVSRMKALVEADPEAFWISVEDNADSIQTSITRSQYLSLAQKLSSVSFEAQRFDYLSGLDTDDNEHDEVHIEAEDNLPLILDLFYLER
ncbi:MAG: LCP family protein [Candidatus Ventricola sp.]